MKQIDQATWNAVAKENIKNFIALSFGSIVFDAKVKDRKDIKLYVLDHIDIKTFEINYADLAGVRDALRILTVSKFFVREGFTDRSLNTEVYSPIERFTYLVFSMELNYQDLVNIVNKVEAAYQEHLPF